MSDLMSTAKDYIQSYFPGTDITVDYDDALRVYTCRYNDGSLDDCVAMVGVITAIERGLGPALLTALRKELDATAQ